MEVQEFLNPDIIKVGLEGNNKDSVLRELAELLKEADYIDDVKVFLEDIYKREEEGETGIGNYIAIPHGKSSTVKKIGVAIGVLNNEIEWETLDGNGVKVVILFSVGNGKDGAMVHLRLLSKFAQKLGNDDVVNNLIKSKNINDVINSFGLSQKIC